MKSGKTLASDWFAQEGITIVDADVVAREVVAVGSPALTEIKETFGDWVIQADGSLDRTALRQHVFAHPEARLALEKITHPRIYLSLTEQLARAESPYVILVSPLLLEGMQRHLVNRILLVDVPEEMQLARASSRDQQAQAQIAQIMKVQMPREEKKKLAHDIVDNSGEKEALYAQLETLHANYLGVAESI